MKNGPRAQSSYSGKHTNLFFPPGLVYFPPAFHSLFIPWTDTDLYYSWDIHVNHSKCFPFWKKKKTTKNSSTSIAVELNYTERTEPWEVDTFRKTLQQYEKLLLPHTHVGNHTGLLSTLILLYFILWYRQIKPVLMSSSNSSSSIWCQSWLKTFATVTNI